VACMPATVGLGALTGPEGTPSMYVVLQDR
jgi:hypothetical protein